MEQQTARVSVTWAGLMQLRVHEDFVQCAAEKFNICNERALSP